MGPVFPVYVPSFLVSIAPSLDVFDTPPDTPPRYGSPKEKGVFRGGGGGGGGCQYE